MLIDNKALDTNLQGIILTTGFKNISKILKIIRHVYMCIVGMLSNISGGRDKLAYFIYNGSHNWLTTMCGSIATIVGELCR